MSKLRQYAWTVGRWILVGLSVALTAVLYGRRAKGLKIDAQFSDLKAEENSRAIQDATNDTQLKLENTEIQNLPKTIAQMSDEAVSAELKKRGLE